MVHIAPKRVIGRHFFLEYAPVADDRGENIVEVVGHATGQLADRLHLLRLQQLLVELLVLGNVEQRCLQPDGRSAGVAEQGPVGEHGDKLPISAAELSLVAEHLAVAQQQLRSVQVSQHGIEQTGALDQSIFERAPLAGSDHHWHEVEIPGPLVAVGIDIRMQQSKTVDGFRDEPFDRVITVCDDAAETFPVFPNARAVSLVFPDPSRAIGTDEQRTRLKLLHRRKGCVKVSLTTGVDDL